MGTSGTTRGTQAKVPVKASGPAAETDSLSVRALARGLSVLAMYDVDHRE
jgi:hypothetical protein